MRDIHTVVKDPNDQNPVGMNDVDNEVTTMRMNPDRRRKFQAFPADQRVFTRHPKHLFQFGKIFFCLGFAKILETIQINFDEIIFGLRSQLIGHVRPLWPLNGPP